MKQLWLPNNMKIQYNGYLMFSLFIDQVIYQHKVILNEGSKDKNKHLLLKDIDLDQTFVAVRIIPIYLLFLYN